MSANDDETTEEQLQSEPGRPLESLGRAGVRIDVDEETYERLHEEYCRAVEHGYSDGFDTFAYNYSSTSSYVTVDGEPIDPDVSEE
jgi:hypothetical protein